MTTKTTLRRLTAGMGALALAVAGVIALAVPASAAVGPDQPDAPKTGTLTINKYSGAPTDNPDPANLLDGVEFTVTQVGRVVGSACTPIDLAVAADWAGLSGPSGLFASAPAAPASPFCLTTTKQVKATSAGQAIFDLNVGVYYVQETNPGPNSIVSPVPPFYVSIPTSEGADGNGWNYNVVADPKNQLMEKPTKTIDEDQAELVVGSEVEWTITVPIPTLNNDETFNSAIITDSLDSRLTLVPGSSVVTIDGASTSNFDVTGNAVWTFNAAGRSELNDAMGKNLTITFKTKVNSVGDGTTPNDAYSSSFNGTTVPGEVVPYTYWGQLSILKVDDSRPTALKLEGATFVVFPSADGRCEAAAPRTGTPTATGTSDADGVVQWAGVTPTNVLGLWIANVDDGPADPTPTKVYCVYETVAPAGHTLVPAGHPVTIKAGEAEINELTVVNTKKDGPNLPLTGGTMSVVLPIAGLLIVGGGVAALVISRRRRHTEV